MKFIVFVKASAETEAGVMPTEAQLTEMGAYKRRSSGRKSARIRRGMSHSSRFAKFSLSKISAMR